MQLCFKVIIFTCITFTSPGIEAQKVIFGIKFAPDSFLPNLLKPTPTRRYALSTEKNLK